MEKKFPTILKKLRKEKNLSQEELAKKFNLTSATISRYEIGIREPDQELLQKLANFFNVSIDYLLGRTDIPNQVREEKTDYQTEEEFTEEEQIQIEAFKEFIKSRRKINEEAAAGE